MKKNDIKLDFERYKISGLEEAILAKNKSISQLELPIPLEEGKHFVSFENKEDLIKKIDFYLSHQELRKEIALNGRQLLEKNYSPKKHGDEILNKIFEK